MVPKVIARLIKQLGLAAPVLPGSFVTFLKTITMRSLGPALQIFSFPGLHLPATPPNRPKPTKGSPEIHSPLVYGTQKKPASDASP